MNLAPDETLRYGRHLVLPEVGVEGQLRLRSHSVLVVGAGGLGSPVALYLAAAGVGRIGLCDFDAVDLSNLQRQVLYGTDDVGRRKVEAACARLQALNPTVRVEPHDLRLTAANALDLLRSYDVVVDGTDNFPTRYLVNDACVLLGKPNVYGSIFRFEGQVSVFWAGHGPCYRCLFPEAPPAGAVPNCAEGGVLGVLPGIIGALQAAEALKLLLGAGTPLCGRMLLLDALELRFRELTLSRDRDCAVCGERPTRRALVDDAPACAAATGGVVEILPGELAQRLLHGDRPVLLDVRTPQEWSICRLEGARLIPIQELPARLGELDPAQEIVAYCHHGVRGRAAVELLRERGFPRVANLGGGLDGWASEVDPSMPRY